VKAISLLQPWASLVASGEKQIETRSWVTSYRGVLAIAASKGFNTDDRELCEEWPFDEALQKAGFVSWRDLPRGGVVAICTLATCRPTERGMINLRGWEHWQDRFVAGPGPFEVYFGDYSDGRYGWLLADIKPLLQPIPCKGALGLWDVPTDTVMAINDQVGLVLA